MFKWKIPTRKGGKQEKLNNELNNKKYCNNAKKKIEKEPENNRRNAALNESIDQRALETNGAPHRAPSHPAPPDCPPAENRGHHSPDQSLPPHSTYPVSSTYGAPPQPLAGAGRGHSPAPSPGAGPASCPASVPTSGPASHPASSPTQSTAVSQTAGQTSRYPAAPPPAGVLRPTQPRPPPYVPPPSGRNGIYGTVPARVRVKTSQATQVEEEVKAGDAHNTSMASTTTDGSRPEAGSSSWMEWTQQLQAYVAWVNSQLRKKEGYKLVTDLRADLHSGVVLADLIEIVSGEKIAGIHRLPETAQMMRENVERVLQFMATKRIRMHHVSSKEVIEGNLKAVMRLILALAAHYKPQSVRTSPYDGGATSTTPAEQASSSNTTATSASAPVKPTASKPSTPASTPAASPSAATSVSTASPSSSATVTGSPSAPSTPSTPGTVSTPATSGTAGTAARRSGLSGSVTTPNLNVPGNRKSIGHLLEGGLSVAPLRRFPSVAGHQWSAVGADADADVDADVDDGTETRVDDDEPTAARPERRGRRQWGLPGPPLYENLPRSNSFASYGSERPRLQPAPPDAAEGIYDVPRTRPARVHEGPASLGADLSRTTQTDGRGHREIVDGFSSLPRHGVRPAALDFWENMTAHSTGTSSPNTSGEFRYNTVHRMSGRRMLPKTPDSRSRGGQPTPGGPAKACDEPEERSLGSRGEVEGSSSHGSPTTSIARSREEAVAEWLRGTPARRSDSWARPEPAGPGAPAAGELWRHSALRRSVQLEGWAGRQGAARGPYGAPPPPAEPPSYDALLEELGRARRQLVALQELVSLLNGQQAGGSECRGTNTADEFVFLKSRLQNTSEKCNLLQADLNKAKQNLINEDSDRIEDLKSNVRNPFNRQVFSTDQGDLGARLSAQDRELQELRRQLADKDKAIHLQQSQFDDAIKALATSSSRPALNGKVTPQSPVLKARGSGREEMHILRDAISSLRASFRESDPNHHTLDTLEQCVAVVLDRLTAAETGRQIEAPESQPPNKRAPITSLQGHNTYTKVVYYTEKTLTPFLSSIPKQLGEITLRDFKQIFDRPGNYRFHFKSMDPEFGMVKEEISNDEEILPGFDGKLISWVVEDHGA